VIPAVVAVVLLIGGGVFVAVTVSQHHKPTATPGPFTGTYTADLGPQTDLDGKPYDGATPATETWGVRSVCRPGGCVATASRRTGKTTAVSTMVFDDVGGRWVAVAVGSGTCANAPAERWEVVTLQPHPDGTLSGEHSSTASNVCARLRTVTFTRTGDVDVASLPDPVTQPPRVVSAAEALHGRYHYTRTHPDGYTYEYDLAVRTDCLRTGDRCMSYFYGPNGRYPLLFGGGKWIVDINTDAPCTGSHTTAEYPLPQPLRDPITPLTGHGHVQTSGCPGGDFNDNFVRTGD
jgi:serine/threonine-protein kinase